MKSWFSLYIKEFRSMFLTIMVSVILVVAWDLYLITKMNNWPMGLTFGLGFIPFLIFPLVLMLQGFQSYRKEWENDTIYLLRTLVSPGYQISLAKLSASLTYYLLVTILTGVIHFSSHWVQLRFFLSEIPEPVSSSFSANLFILGALAYLFFGIMIYIISQFSYLVSCFFSRFRWVITVMVFNISFYIVFRVGTFLSLPFKWLPDLPVQVMWSGHTGTQEYLKIYLGSGPLVATLLILIGIFITGGWLMKNQLDV